MIFYYKGKKYILPPSFQEISSLTSFEYFLKKEYPFLGEIPYNIYVDEKLVKKTDDIVTIMENAKELTFLPQRVFNEGIKNPWIYFTINELNFWEIGDAGLLEPLIQKIIKREPRKKLNNNEIQFFKKHVFHEETLSSFFILQMMLELALGDIPEIHFEENGKNISVLDKNNKIRMIVTSDFRSTIEHLIGQNFNLTSLAENIHPDDQCIWGLVSNRSELRFTCYWVKEIRNLKKKLQVSDKRSFCGLFPFDEKNFHDIIHIIRFICETNHTQNATFSGLL